MSKKSEKDKSLTRLVVGYCCSFVAFWMVFKYYISNISVVLAMVWIVVTIGCILAPFFVIKIVKQPDCKVKDYKLFRNISVVCLIVVSLAMVGQSRIDRQEYANSFSKVEVTEESIQGDYAIVDIDVPLVDYVLGLPFKGLQDGTSVKTKLLRIENGKYLERNLEGFNITGTYVVKDGKLIVTADGRDTEFSVSIKKGIQKNHPEMGEVSVLELYKTSFNPIQIVHKSTLSGESVKDDLSNQVEKDYLYLSGFGSGLHTITSLDSLNN